MRAEYIKSEFEKADITKSIDPKEIAQQAGLSFVNKLLFAWLWPKVEPFIKKKLGDRFAELIEGLLLGI